MLWVKLIIIFTTDDSCNHQTVFTAYLPSLKYYARVSPLWTWNIDLRHQGQFLMPDSQIQTNNVLQHMINNKDSIQFPQKFSKKALKWSWLWNQNTLKVLSFKLLRKFSKVIGRSLDIFGSIWKSSENRIYRSHQDVLRNPSHDKAKNSCMWLEKVGS